MNHLYFYCPTNLNIFYDSFVCITEYNCRLACAELLDCLACVELLDLLVAAELVDWLVDSLGYFK